MKHLLRATLFGALLAGAAACDNDPTGSDPPAQVAVSGGGDQVAPAGTVLAQPITVTVTDDDGDPVQGVEVRFQVISGGGNVYPTMDSTDASGQASTDWRLGTVAADSQKVQVDVMRPGSSTVAAQTIVRATAQAGAPRTLAVASGNSQTGAPGATLPDSLTVRLADEAGNGVPGVTITWQVGQMGGTVSAPTTASRADGTARVAWTLPRVQGAFQVQASAPGVAPVTFVAAVTDPGITITITQPTFRAYGDSLPIMASAQSTSPIVRLTARVEGRETNLSAGQGTLNLAGLAEGEKTLVVWAITSAGDSSGLARRFIYNRAPQLTVVAPTRGTVLRSNTVRIDADCVDPSGCTRVAVYAKDFADAFGTPVLLAEGTTSFHGDVSVAAFNGERKYIHVVATDALNGSSTAVVGPYYIENTPTWTEVGSGGFQALDADDTRLLYVDSIGGTARVMVRALSGGTPTELLNVPAGHDVLQGRLFAGGAIFATTDAIYEWRGGVTSVLADPPPYTYPLVVEGDWALWHEGTSVYRRNLATGTTSFVATALEAAGSDVAFNGDVVFTAPDREVYRWRNGVTTPISNGLSGYLPLTDGTSVAWLTLDGRIYVSRGVPQLVSHLAAGYGPHEFYEVNGGWTAYVKPDVGGIGHVYAIAPDGTHRQVSAGGESRISAVGPAGEVVYRQPANFGRRYLVEPPYTGSRLDVGGNLGVIRFEGPELFVIVGRSVFRVNF